MIITEWHVDCDGWPASDLGAHEDAICIDGPTSRAELLEALRHRGWTISRYAGEWKCRCPQHNDRSARATRRRELDAFTQYCTDLISWTRRNLARTDHVLCTCTHVGTWHQSYSGQTAWPLECGHPACECIVYVAAAELAPAEPKPVRP